MYKHKVASNIKRAVTFAAYVRRCYFGAGLPESVYFYTFHKCASTLFSSYVLKNLKGLLHVDYAARIYQGKLSEKVLDFREKGFVYGPIRLSANPAYPTYRMLIEPLSRHEFVRDKRAIFFVRDPRDILVSAYYSFGYTHSLSDVQHIREIQEASRKKIQSRSLDEYVLEHADTQARYFATLYELSRACERGVVLRYEDLVDNFDSFIGQLCSYVAIDDEVVREIYRRSRPRKQEDASSHRRSGQIGSFRDKLKEETVALLNGRLEGTLKMFGYEV